MSHLVSLLLWWWVVSFESSDISVRILMLIKRYWGLFHLFAYTPKKDWWCCSRLTGRRTKRWTTISWFRYTSHCIRFLLSGVRAWFSSFESLTSSIRMRRTSDDRRYENCETRCFCWGWKEYRGKIPRSKKSDVSSITTTSNSSTCKAKSSVRWSRPSLTTRRPRTSRIFATGMTLGSRKQVKISWLSI